MGCNTTFRGETKKAAYEAGLFVRVGSISGFRAGSVAKYPPGPAHTLERFCTTILEILGIAIFLYMGRSSVTAAKLFFHVVREKI